VVEELVISGGSLNATGVVGSLAGQFTKSLLLTGQLDIECRASEHCMSANQTDLRNASGGAHTTASRFFGEPPTAERVAGFVVRYSGPSTKEGIQGAPVLHFASIPLPAGLYTLTFEDRDRISVGYAHEPGESLLVGLSNPGNYTVAFKGDRASGRLCHAGGAVFPVWNEEALFENSSVCSEQPTRSPTPAAGKWETEVIVGIAVGAGVPLLCVIVIGVCWVKRSSRGKAVPASMTISTSDAMFT
jgi:hypothetical protein